MMNPDALIEFGLVALAVVAGIGIALAVLTALDRSKQRQAKRITGVVVRAAPQSRVAVEATRLARAPKDSRGLVQLIPKKALLAQRLGQAGYAKDPKRYVIACVVVGVLCGGGAFIAGLPMIVWPTATLAGALLLPHVWLSSRITAREMRFLGNLPEGIDIVVRGLKAGLPVSESLAAVGREAPEPVGGVFREIVDQVRVGQSIEGAIEKQTETMAVQELRFLGITLSIQKETGGNLTETLQNLSDILRKRRQMKVKVRAVSSEARTSAYIIGSLPFVVSLAIYIVNTDYVMTLFTDPRGVIMVAVGLGSIAFGAAVMAKMVRFEI